MQGEGARLSLFRSRESLPPYQGFRTNLSGLICLHPMVTINDPQWAIRLRWVLPIDHGV